MSRDSIIIIGAGIGGLSAGCYARMNGYRTNIFEMHSRPGGSCTSWKRKGYTFDYCIHNLSATSIHSRTHPIWEELGAFRGAKVVPFKESVQVEDESGKTLRMVTELEDLRKRMLVLAPKDAELINGYVKGVKKLRGFDMFAMMMGGVGPKISVIRYLRALNKWGAVTLQQYGEKFQDPFMHRAFPVIQYGISDMPVLAQLAMFSGIVNGDNGWLVGGSSVLANNLERRYKGLGGEILYSKRVNKIIVKDDKAVGVVLDDGSERFADLIVSNADGHATIFDMLDGKYISETARAYYRDWVPETQEFGLEIFIGAAIDVSNEPHAIALLLDRPIRVEGREFDRLDIGLFKPEMGLSPEGKAVIKVVFPSSYAYWKELSADKQRYSSEKERIGKMVVSMLEKRFPGLSSKVEVVDVMTPLTVERFIGAYRGLQSWVPKIGMSELMKNGVSRELPGLGNFHMVGQFASGMVGLMTAALAGRSLVKRLCKEDGKRFMTSRAV